MMMETVCEMIHFSEKLESLITACLILTNTRSDNDTITFNIHTQLGVVVLSRHLN